MDFFSRNARAVIVIIALVIFGSVAFIASPIGKQLTGINIRSLFGLASTPGPEDSNDYGWVKVCKVAGTEDLFVKYFTFDIYVDGQIVDTVDVPAGPNVPYGSGRGYCVVSNGPIPDTIYNRPQGLYKVGTAVTITERNSTDPSTIVTDISTSSGSPLTNRDLAGKTATIVTVWHTTEVEFVNVPGDNPTPTPTPSPTPTPTPTPTPEITPTPTPFPTPTPTPVITPTPEITPTPTPEITPTPTPEITPTPTPVITPTPEITPTPTPVITPTPEITPTPTPVITPTPEITPTPTPVITPTPTPTPHITPTPTPTPHITPTPTPTPTSTCCGGSTPRGKLSISKVVNNETLGGVYSKLTQAKTGERASFRISITNTGGAAVKNVLLKDILPTGLNIDTATIRIDNNASNNISNAALGTINKNQTVLVIFSAVVTAPGGSNICNIAKTSGDNVSEISDSACIQVTDQPGTPNITLSKRAFNDTKNINAVMTTAVRGNYITYSLITSNSGTGAAIDYIIRDDLSDVLPMVDIVDLNGGTLNGNILTYPATIIAPGQTVVKTFKVKIKTSLQANQTYELHNYYGDTIIINVPATTIFKAPKAGVDGIPVSAQAVMFSTLLTGAFVVIRKRKTVQKLVVENKGSILAMLTVIILTGVVFSAPGVSTEKILGSPLQTHTVQTNVLTPINAEALGAHPEGTLINGLGEDPNAVWFVVKEGPGIQRRLFSSSEVFLSHGYQWERVVPANSGDALLPEGREMELALGTLVTDITDPQTYWVIYPYRQKRAFANMDAFSAMGYKASMAYSSDLSSYTAGEPIKTIEAHAPGSELKDAAHGLHFVDYNKERLVYASSDVYNTWHTSVSDFARVLPMNELDMQAPVGGIAPTRF